MKITSVNNDLVKETAKLLKTKYREETGLFLIEGEKGVEEAFTAGLEIEKVFVLDGYNKFNNENIIETTEAVLSKITDTKTPPKVVAVAKQPKQDIEKLKNANKIILLEGIKDSGNLGTILRTAAAFAIDGIILFGDTVDLYNPKCVRSTVGNLWKIPVIKVKSIEEFKQNFSDYERIATLPKNNDTITLKEYNPQSKTIIMFGSEADGLTKDLIDFSTQKVSIEMSKNVESLNLSVSASVIMYKLFIN